MAAALILSATLAGCTAGFLYNRVDLLVSWYVNGLVSLNDNQEDRLRDSIRGALSWHRQTQIPQYIGLLNELKQQLQATVTPADLERRYQDFASLLDVTIAHLVPEAAGLLSTLSVDQVAELAESLAEDNEDLRDEYSGATPEVRARKRARNALRTLRRFAGRLGPAQRTLVESQMAALHDNSEAWLDRRRQWQERFSAILRERPPHPEFDAALRDLVLNPNQFDSAEYREHVEHNRAVIMRMLADVINGLDARQKQHLLRKLDEYAENLHDIAQLE